MPDQQKNVEHKKRGRPAGRKQDATIGIRISEDLIERIEAWASKEGCSRAEAIRRLVELALKSSSE
jgi:predicted DNA binding CopG/RHH family protein